MRVFLAGATGFVGGAIRDELVANGHSVTALSRDVASLAGHPRIGAVAGDVAEPGPWSVALRGHDAVVNAVGLLRERGSNTFQRCVVEGARNLVEAAHNARVKRFVQVSANGIDAARVPYQRTKLEAERIVRGSGLDWTIWRPSLVIGPRDDLTNRFARLFRWFRLVPYFGDGRYALAPVAASDLARAIVRGMNDAKSRHATYEACGPQAIPYKEFLRTIRRVAKIRGGVVYAPRWVGYVLAGLFGRFRWFPADVDSLRMLFEGNTCRDVSWVRLLDRAPQRFEVALQKYLGR